MGENTCRRPTWSPSLTDGKSYQPWLFTDTGPSHPSQGPPPGDPSPVSDPLLAFLRGQGHLRALRGMLEGARLPLVCARPGAWTAGLLLVLRAGLDWALQASGGRAGRGAGRWAASQAAGQ